MLPLPLRLQMSMFDERLDDLIDARALDDSMQTRSRKVDMPNGGTREKRGLLPARFQDFDPDPRISKSA